MNRLSRVKIEWCPNFAYAIGLITTDGNLSPDGRHLNLTSKDEEIILNFKSCLNIKNKTGRKNSGSNKEKIYFSLHFGDKNFYEFLLSIGLTPAKSRNLKKVKIKDEFFPDFLRGCLDGDGNISITKHPESRYNQLRVRFASASPEFLIWMKTKIKEVLDIDGGYIVKNGSCPILGFGKSDSIKILEFIYYNNVEFKLTRKYSIFKNAMGEWRNWHTRTI